MKKLVIVLAVGLVIGATQATTLLQYDFSDGSGGSATDLSGQGNNGTLNGFTDTSAGAGQFGVSEGWVAGGGLSILVGDADRSYVETPLLLSAVSGDWTIEYSANADSGAEWAPAVGSSVHWTSGAFVGLNYTNNEVLVAGTLGNVGASPFTLPGDQSDASIHHVAMVYDSATSTVEAFVDGISAGTLGGIAAMSGDVGEVFRIGNTGWGSGEQWDGVLYGVAISDEKLAPGSFVIPEPMTLSLLGLGGLSLIRRRRN